MTYDVELWRYLSEYERSGRKDKIGGVQITNNTERMSIPVIIFLVASKLHPRIRYGLEELKIRSFINLHVQPCNDDKGHKNKMIDLKVL